MNIREGARRIKYVGSFALIVATFFLIIGLALTAIKHANNAALLPAHVFFPVIILLFYLAIIGALFLVAGWIIEGFAEPPRPSTRRDHAGD
jgi:uncharacterized integral membrane protein